MAFDFTERPSDSPLVNLIWRTESGAARSFTTVAGCHWEMVITQQRGQTCVTLVGPETRSTPAPIPEDATFIGIQFKLGAFMPHLSPSHFVDTGMQLPDASRRAFWLQGSAWAFPDYDNADTFVERLVREGLLVFDPTVKQALHNESVHLSPRSVQRAFVRATGLSQRKIAQIERARRAMTLLESGISILDTVVRAGYADQAHLTRSLKHLVGRTPAQLLRQR